MVLYLAASPATSVLFLPTLASSTPRRAVALLNWSDNWTFDCLNSRFCDLKSAVVTIASAFLRCSKLFSRCSSWACGIHRSDAAINGMYYKATKTIFHQRLPALGNQKHVQPSSLTLKVSGNTILLMYLFLLHRRQLVCRPLWTNY